MVDLRSDTVTRPTREMREAMRDAEVGDDVYGEDPTVRLLEETAADLLGKEAALLVTSGTQGNQAAVLAHTQRGDEVIVEAESHIYYYEAGALSSLAGVQPRPLAGLRGAVDPGEIVAAIRPDNVHFPRTRLLCLENTHNRAGGAVLPLAYAQRAYELARRNGLSVHLDGARLFNAAVASGVPARRYAEAADSVQVCLSKGLGAPMGSILAGTWEFVERARRWRKALGGGLRQAGVIAAPGLIALTKMTERLAEDHVRARRLAGALAEMDGLSLDPEDVETNIVVARLNRQGLGEQAFLSALRQQGVQAADFGPGLVRFVTHYDVGDSEIDAAIAAVRTALRDTA